MTENHTEFTGAGSETDPLTFTVRLPAPDAVDVAIGGLAKTAKDYAAAFSRNADLSSNLPADVRQIVSGASDAITSTLQTAYSARVKADNFRNDLSLYPQGREMLANEATKTAVDAVAESFAKADDQLQVASAVTYEAARPRISPNEAMPARADLAMITKRHGNSLGTLVDALRGLAQRSDAVGALVADQGYLGDFLTAQGIDPDMREAILTAVSHEVVKAASLSGDPARAAAARTNLALTELRKARVAANSFTRLILQR
ncbi:hypothetical protein [Streptomyces sp. NPDC056628]|uniref:hypothetical protein n=1 Tax=Streptomyces sp. NPDC056628 TaxID=3345882 RepID=UPI0036B48D38